MAALIIAFLALLVGVASQTEPRHAPTACQHSTLPGYSCMKIVTPDVYNLHWKVKSRRVSFAVEAKTAGWASLAWSPSGLMPGSNAVVGFVGTSANGDGPRVLPYNLNGYAPFQVNPSTSFHIAKNFTEPVRNLVDKHVFKFERELADQGDVPWNTASPSIMIYAFSDSSSLGYHGPLNRGAFNLTLGPAPAPAPHSKRAI